MERVFHNLLDNAVSFSPRDAAIEIDISQHGDLLEIAVSDHGPGIPETELDKVFEPYFRLEASRARHTGGVGLGLPTARAIAELHGGSLVLQSAPGEGVTAVLSLPRSPD